jgi:hypothetical protein
VEVDFLCFTTRRYAPAHPCKCDVRTENISTFQRTRMIED